MIRNGILSGFALAALWIGCAAGSPASPDKSGALTGSWGGQHISLEATDEGARIEYDCAHGAIDGPVVPGRDGRFEAAGTHAAEHGGPVHEGESEEGQPARYRGELKGNTLTLTVTLAGSGEEVGTFTLSRGAAPRLVKCL
jgi:hypothetical protein